MTTAADNKALWPGWETVRLLGRGSFGAVWEIEREVFGHREKAALKVISIPQSESEIEELYSNGYNDESITAHFRDFLTDIIREYTLMAEMKGHTNVVCCDDIRTVQHDDGFGWDIFIRMELLTPLTKALGEQSTEAQAVRLGRDLCRALALCRSRSIVHRDIKPQNIFVSADGDCKLGDFGIAKTMEKTSGGTKIGTYNYMAPEVYNNKPYGHTADICSLGLVLYWLMNERRLPFVPMPPAVPRNADMELARMRRFAGEPIPAPAHGSEALKRIILKACEYDPRDRYQTAEDMLRDLEALDRAQSVSPAPAGAAAGRPRADEEIGAAVSALPGGPDADEDRTASVFPAEKRKAAPAKAAAGRPQAGKRPDEETTVSNSAAYRPGSAPQRQTKTAGAAYAKKKKFPVWIPLVAVLAIAVILLIVLLAVLGGGKEPSGGAAKEPKVTASPAPAASVSTPAPESAPAARAAARGLPAPPDIDINSWEYMLVNADNPLSSDYKPAQFGYLSPTLSERDVKTSYDENRADSAVDLRIAQALSEMCGDAKDALKLDIVYLTACYRSYEYQAENFNRVCQANGVTDGKDKNGFYITMPAGCSEHQSGLCADIIDKWRSPLLADELKDIPLEVWLREHCQEYGFILRFPEGKENITGVMYEPWHFRYVGEAAAKYIMENNLCLEEFISLYDTATTAATPTPEPTPSPTPEPPLTASVSTVISSGRTLLTTSGAEASSFLNSKHIGKAGVTIRYASNAIDGNTTTSWQEAGDGFGINEWLRIDLAGTANVQYLSLWLGNWESKDMYDKNGRPSKLRLEFSDGSSVDCGFPNEMTEFEVKLSKPVRTSYVRFVILGAYPGTRSDWEDTCVSEVKIYA